MNWQRGIGCALVLLGCALVWIESLRYRSTREYVIESAAAGIAFVGLGAAVIP